MSVMPFILPQPPQPPAPMTTEDRLREAERNIFIAIADFSIAVQETQTVTGLLALHHRISGLVTALGAIEDQALMKSDRVCQ